MQSGEERKDKSIIASYSKSLGSLEITTLYRKLSISRRNYFNEKPSEKKSMHLDTSQKKMTHDIFLFRPKNTELPKHNPLRLQYLGVSLLMKDYNFL